jgi:signal transduction histidine kinase
LRRPSLREPLQALEHLSSIVGTAPLPGVLDAALVALCRGAGLDSAAVLVRDPDGVVTFRAEHGWSPELQSAFAKALSRDDTVWDDSALISDVETDPRAHAWRRELVAGGILSVAFLPVRTATVWNGTFALCRRAPQTWTDEDTSIARIIASHVAFAVERAHAESALREAKDELATILSSIIEGISVQDPTGRITYTNEAARRAMGVDEFTPLDPSSYSEVLARFAIEDEDGRELPPDELPGAVASREHKEIRRILRYRSRTGQPRVERWSEVVAIPVIDDGGDLRFTVNVFRDITEERLSRARMEAGEAQLRRALDATREAEEKKDAFLALLGHELRNPLAPIVSSLELMDLKADGHTVRERDVMRRHIRHLHRLVDDLLDVTRITQGRLTLHWTKVDLRETVHHAVEEVEVLVKERGHSLSVKVPAEPVPVRGDSVRLMQTVVNLLTNAARYTPQSGHIDVRLRIDGGTAELSVRDDGMGIDPEDMPRLFDLFARPPREGGPDEGGLGLGLTIVRNLVNLHAGEVIAKSEGVGRGSTFRILLPIYEGVEIDSHRTGPRAVRDGAVRCKVLVVDDNVDAAELLAEALETLGFSATAYHDGPSALAAVEADAPHAALVDIGMPGMDGYELARALRKRPDGGSYFLVALTGFGQHRDRDKAIEAGFDVHMVKPVDLDQVARVLENAGPRG